MARSLVLSQKKERNSSTELPTSSECTGIYIEGFSSSVTLSPTLVDLARVLVIRAVDDQDTGLSAQPAEKKEPTSDRHRPGLSPSERTGRPTGQLERMQPLTSSPRSWSCDSPTRSQSWSRS